MKVKVITFNEKKAIFENVEVKVIKNGYILLQNDKEIYRPDMECCKIEISYPDNEFDVVINEW